MPATRDNAPPSPAGSSASDGSSNSVSTGPPRTPVSTSLPMPTFMNFTGEDTINGVASLGGIKRTSKTTRRVNTAERRATHNAVERQRRETLNGRFLVSTHAPLYFLSSLSFLPTGPCRPSLQPKSDTPPFQICNRQLVHRTSECVASAPHSCGAAAAYDEE